MSALISKLEGLHKRYLELQDLLLDPETLKNDKKLISVSKEIGQLESLIGPFESYLNTQKLISDLELMSKDPEFVQLALEEIGPAKIKLGLLLDELKGKFLSSEDQSIESFFIEIRAGTGGDEAGLFVGDLYEMYRRYCEIKGFTFEVDDFSVADQGGFKEVIIHVSHPTAYSKLKFEAGGHRVQRIPKTETQGRIHTSSATVAVLPEVPEISVSIDMKDIEEGACRSSGPGGQNVNKVSSSWRILHKPSGLQFKMTEHKSQKQNKERAWSLLRATLFNIEQEKRNKSISSARKEMIGSGDRSQRIRTYNYPQNRCTDHRLGGGTGEKNYPLESIMFGQIDPLIDSLIELDRTIRLNSI